MATPRLLARIGKAHGLRGEVTVQLHTDDPMSRFTPGAVLTTEAAPGSGVPRSLTVRSARLHQQTWLLGFEGIPDRTGAEGLRGTRLVVDEAAEPASDDDHDDGEEAYYEDDLVGLTVEDPQGAVVGEVCGLEVGAAQDLLVVRLADGRRALVPFVHAIVPVVDLDARRVVVDAPPGLLDLGA